MMIRKVMKVKNVLYKVESLEVNKTSINNLYDCSITTIVRFEEDIDLIVNVDFNFIYSDSDMYIESLDFKFGEIIVPEGNEDIFKVSDVESCKFEINDTIKEIYEDCIREVIKLDSVNY